MTLDQTVREMTATPEAMKSEHGSMVFSRDRFTRFCISYIFIVIVKTVRTANHIAGFLACTYFGIHAFIHTYIHTYIDTYIHTYTHTYIHTCVHACIHTYIYIVLLNSQEADTERK